MNLTRSRYYSMTIAQAVRRDWCGFGVGWHKAKRIELFNSVRQSRWDSIKIRKIVRLTTAFPYYNTANKWRIAHYNMFGFVRTNQLEKGQKEDYWQLLATFVTLS